MKIEVNIPTEIKYESMNVELDNKQLFDAIDSCMKILSSMSGFKSEDQDNILAKSEEDVINEMMSWKDPELNEKTRWDRNKEIAENWMRRKMKWLFN